MVGADVCVHLFSSELCRDMDTFNRSSWSSWEESCVLKTRSSIVTHCQNTELHSCMCFLPHMYLLQQPVSIHILPFFHISLHTVFSSPQIFLSSPKPLILLKNKHVLFKLLFRNTLRVQPCWAIRTKFKAKLVVQQQFWWAAEKFICINFSSKLKKSLSFSWALVLAVV